MNNAHTWHQRISSDRAWKTIRCTHEPILLRPIQVELIGRWLRVPWLRLPNLGKICRRKPAFQLVWVKDTTSNPIKSNLRCAVYSKSRRGHCSSEWANIEDQPFLTSNHLRQDDITQTCHGHDIAIDDIIDLFLIWNISHKSCRFDDHANVVNQNAELQTIQFGSQFRINGLPVGEVHGQCSDHNLICNLFYRYIKIIKFKSCLGQLRTSYFLCNLFQLLAVPTDKENIHPGRGKLNFTQHLHFRHFDSKKWVLLPWERRLYQFRRWLRLRLITFPMGRIILLDPWGYHMIYYQPRVRIVLVAEFYPKLMPGRWHTGIGRHYVTL